MEERKSPAPKFLGSWEHLEVVHSLIKPTIHPTQTRTLFPVCSDSHDLSKHKSSTNILHPQAAPKGSPTTKVCPDEAASAARPSPLAARSFPIGSPSHPNPGALTCPKMGYPNDGLLESPFRKASFFGSSWCTCTEPLKPPANYFMCVQCVFIAVVHFVLV